MIASELVDTTDSKDARSLQNMIAHFCRRVLLTILIQDRDYVFVFDDTYRLLTQIALGRFAMKGVMNESTLTKPMRRVLSITKNALLESTSLRRAALQLLDQKRRVLYVVFECFNSFTFSYLQYFHFFQIFKLRDSKIRRISYR